MALFNVLKSFQPSCEDVVKYFSSRNFFPNKVLGGNFYSDRRESFFQTTQKNIETQNEWVSVFLCSRTDVVWKLISKTKQIVYYRYE